MKKSMWLVFGLGIVILNTNPGYSKNGRPIQTDKEYPYEAHNRPLEKVISDLEFKFMVIFNYTDKDLRNAKPVTVNCKASTFQELLDCVFADQPISPYYKNGYYFFRQRNTSRPAPAADSVKMQDVSGVVLDEDNKPVADATITIENVGAVGKTNQFGEFRVITSMLSKSIIISCLGFENKVVALPCEPRQKINLVLFQKELDANYVTVKRESPQAVAHIVPPSLPQTRSQSLFTNLSGVTPGLFIRASNGSPNTSGNILIRGESRIFDGILGSDYELNGPQIILDKMPIPNILINQYEYQGGNPNTIGRTRGGNSIFRIINQDNIESIEILKDAASTSIYGSRGGNGVIIINTKKGTANTPQLSVNGSTGFGISRKYFNYLAAPEYKDMREAGFRYDSIVINKQNAPDLYWKQSSDNNFYKLATGGTASILKGSISTGGITSQMNYNVAINFYKEGSPIQDKQLGQDFYDRDIHIQGRMENQSRNGKLNISLNGLYYSGKINSVGNDFTKIRLFAATAPRLVDSAGKLVWDLGVNNPLSYGLNTYRSNIDNVLCSFETSYQIDSNLKLKSRFGIILLQNNETVIIPIKAQDPSRNPTGSTEFGSTSFKNTRAEFIAEYKRAIGKLKTSTLAGFTIDRQSKEDDRLLATGYTSDLQLYDVDAAADTKASNDVNKYGYVGSFLNSQLDYDKKYLLNLTLRRDGSSRFGGNKKYGWFGAIGAGYILTKAPFLKLPEAISFAKLRASYGISGNDHIGDFGYRNIYTVMGGNAYAGNQAIQPAHHLNENFSWEEKRQFEVATDFTIDNIFNFTMAYYRNISTKLLISQSMPSSTGFGTIIRNSDAKVRNTGLELSVQKRGNELKPLYWQFTFSLTVPKTKVIKFPGLQSSNYANQVRLYEPLNVQLGYTSNGVNPQTGYYTFGDQNKDELYNSKDYVTLGDLDPKLYGGFQNVIGLKKLVLDFSWEFVVQKGINQLMFYSPMIFSSDGFSNVPVQFMNYWKNPGDNVPYQRPTANSGTTAASTGNLQKNSDAFLVNANFLRLKNVSFSYTLGKFINKKRSKFSTKLIASAENALVITKYKGADPGSQNYRGIAPLKRYMLGFQFNIK